MRAMRKVIAATVTVIVVGAVGLGGYALGRRTLDTHPVEPEAAAPLTITWALSPPGVATTLAAGDVVYSVDETRRHGAGRQLLHQPAQVDGVNFDCDPFYVADRVALLGDGRVACRISVGGRTTEARHVAAGWELLQSVAG